MNIDQYFKTLRDEVDKQFAIAREAKKIGIDPISEVEIPIATSLGEKAIGLISTVYPQLQNQKIIDRIAELEKQYGQLDTTVSFKIAEEIAREKFCKFESLLQAMDAGIRVGFSYITLGVVSSPIEGFTELKTQKTRDGKGEYLVAYFSGPIRSAGTTAGCVTLMLIDYLRETFGFAKFDPDENEVKRYVTENYDYHERVTNLQYLPTEEELTFLAQNIPIKIAGEPTSEREVSNYKDLPRIETNLIRGGMCLIMSESLAQKAQKGLRLWRSVQKNGLKVTGWEFLDKYIEIKNKKKSEGKSDNVPTYIKDLVAGRPVYGHPSKSGSFRFRYGRSRSNGFSAASIHPATMEISNKFLSTGTQLKIEKPTKGCTISSCDQMDGPIVKLRDGSVRKILDCHEAREIYPDVEEIIYIGDILFTFGDVLNRNYKMLKPAYVEEWWELQLKSKGFEGELDKFNVSFEDALKISEQFKIPLHPEYIFYWKEISLEQFQSLISWLSKSSFVEGKLVLPYTKADRENFSSAKRALELIGCPHDVTLENLVIQNPSSLALLFNLGFTLDEDFNSWISQLNSKSSGFQIQDVLEIINELSPITIKDKSGTFIGARMGRPEKAKLRKLTGSPHTLFPVSDQGGRLRSFQSAYDIGYVDADFPIYYCEHCSSEKIYPTCTACGTRCKKMFYCRNCDKTMSSKCDKEDHQVFESKRRKLNIRELFDEAKKSVGVRAEEIPIVKGIRGTSNLDHSCEHLGKGLLRAKYGLNVNKDGTIRYDMTEMAMTHFKPKEIRTSVEKLISLGYENDIHGNPLKNENQILELFPHDIVLPVCKDSLDEPADKVFLKISNFIDDELEKLYKKPRLYNAKSSEDVLGSLVVCIAPHICTATVGRIIGFSKNQTLMASPYMHAAMRRDADGDEAAALMLMDLLLNFSKKFLPAHRGGTQDAPLVLNTYIRAGDVDDQILDFEVGPYPLELYEAAEQGLHSSEVKVETVKQRLKESKDPFTSLFFTHGTDDFNQGVVNTSYKILPTMEEKVGKQMELCEKIRAVDTSDVARLIIERHFIRDTRGNLRKFSQQGFRCVSCNEKFRRVPLAGKCSRCGGKVIFTISEGSILKYMQRSLDLARKYNVSNYILQSLELTEMYIHSIFGKEKEKQEALNQWFN